MPKTTIVIEGYRCYRCTHKWIPNLKHRDTGQDPVMCPKCKSPYWNRPRLE